MHEAIAFRTDDLRAVERIRVGGPAFTDRREGHAPASDPSSRPQSGQAPASEASPQLSLAASARRTLRRIISPSTELRACAAGPAPAVPPVIGDNAELDGAIH